MNKKSLIIFGIFISVVLLISCISAKQVFLRPSGSVNSYKSWTTSGCTEGQDYKCVDEVNPTSDFIWTRTNGLVNIHHMQNLNEPEEINKINFVETRIYAKESLVWEWFWFRSYDKIKPALYFGSFEFEYGYEVDLAGGYKYYKQRFYKNPHTNKAWTREDIDNLRAGVRSTEGGIVSKFDVLVDYTISDCGNEVIEGGEVCDGLNVPTCQDLGYTEDFTYCASDCKSVDSSRCNYYTCSKTDLPSFPEGSNLLLQGTIEGTSREDVPFSHTDYCLDSDILIEYTCTYDDLFPGYRSFEQSCSGSYNSSFTCIDGACV